MASTTFTKRNLNRFKKVYPPVREESRDTLIAKNETKLEIGAISFSSTAAGAYDFTESFNSAPNITIIGVDSESNSQANVNVWVQSVTTTQLIVSSSNTFTGQIHFHAQEIVT